MSFPAAGGPEEEHGAHGPARLPGLHFDALEEPEDGIGGLGLADHMGGPAPRDVLEPGASCGGPQGDPFFGFFLDAYAGWHCAPLTSDIPSGSAGQIPAGCRSPSFIGGFEDKHEDSPAYALKWWQQ